MGAAHNREITMQSMNTQRLFLGGLVAGVVLNVQEYVVNGIVLKEEWEAAMQTAGLETYSTSGLIMLVLMTLVLGFISVWLYAAIRPRFGPGPRTAVYAAFLVWLLVSVVPTVYNSLAPIFPPGLMMTASVFALFELPIATVAGAWLYREEPAATDTGSGDFGESSMG